MENLPRVDVMGQEAELRDSADPPQQDQPHCLGTMRKSKGNRAQSKPHDTGTASPCVTTWSLCNPADKHEQQLLEPGEEAATKDTHTHRGKQLRASQGR